MLVKGLRKAGKMFSQLVPESCTVSALGINPKDDQR